MTLTLTPEQRGTQEREIREWPQIIESRYDFAALTSFLKKTVAENKRWKNIDLTKPKIGNEWIDRGCSGGRWSMASGDWNFRASNPNENKFMLSFLYYYNIFGIKRNRGLEVTFNCIRKSKDNFELVEIIGDEFEIHVSTF